MNEEKISNKRNGIQVIARAASILRALKESPKGMSLGDIAKQVDLPRSTVQRIAGALITERFIISDMRGGSLKLGPELNKLADSVEHSIVERCGILLSEMTRITGETTDLSVLCGDRMIFLDQVHGTHRLRTVSFVGDAFPLTTTANGKACLSRLPEDQALELIRKEWRRNGVHGDSDSIKAELRVIRKTGLAYDIDQHTSGISAVGIAFSDWSGDLHAISVPVPSTRFQEAKYNVENALLITAEKIDKVLNQSK